MSAEPAGRRLLPASSPTSLPLAAGGAEAVGGGWPARAAVAGGDGGRPPSAVRGLGRSGQKCRPGSEEVGGSRDLPSHHPKKRLGGRKARFAEGGRAGCPRWVGAGGGVVAGQTGPR